MQSRRIITPEDAQKFAAFITGMPLPVTMTWRDGKVRTNDQNALLHKWYGEVGQETGQDAAEVKGQSHHQWGVPIRSRDPQWLYLWDAVKARLEQTTPAQRKGRTVYELECSFLATGNLKVSSGMTTKELSEYMDAMHRHYSQQGVWLTQPEDR